MGTTSEAFLPPFPGQAPQLCPVALYFTLLNLPAAARASQWADENCHSFSVDDFHFSAGSHHLIGGNGNSVPELSSYSDIAARV